MGKGKKKDKTTGDEGSVQPETEKLPESEDIETAVDKSDDKDKSEDKTIEQKIDDEEARIDELNDKYLRLAAEFDNYKKRNARQYEYMVNSATDRILVSILEVVDNFERALGAAEESAEFKSFKEGTELIYQHLQDLLTKEGVAEIKAVGEKFDPNLHEAMMQTASDEYDEGIITEEMLRGYKRNGRVLRHSKVVVSKGSACEEDEKENQER
jgi:molecular chaperone GrpE